MADRPLSPHISIWKWGPAMFVSILHRITGDGLALVGIGVLLWWLAALAGGGAAYEDFVALATTPYGYIVLVGISWAAFTHAMSGLRHFVLDAGAGFELGENKGWAIVSPILGILLTAAFWAALIYL
jgi:succinate dehydrogenase / fumarate reductase cytochrome b subunit